MKKIILLIISLGFIVFSSCEESDILNDCIEGIEYTDYTIDFHEIIGYDDWGSPGAAFVTAVDSSKNTALIVALKFDLPLYTHILFFGNDHYLLPTQT